MLLLYRNTHCGVLPGRLGTLRKPVYRIGHKPDKVDAVVLAVSASLRLGSGNQNIYLAEVMGEGTKRQWAKLLDIYPSSGDPIRLAVLVERKAVRMIINRTPDRDTTAAASF